jgi:hypothetical protein
VKVVAALMLPPLHWPTSWHADLRIAAQHRVAVDPRGACLISVLLGLSIMRPPKCPEGRVRFAPHRHLGKYSCRGKDRCKTPLLAFGSRGRCRILLYKASSRWCMEVSGDPLPDIVDINNVRY